jgi:hypothetical protein
LLATVEVTLIRLPASVSDFVTLEKGLYVELFVTVVVFATIP